MNTFLLNEARVERAAVKYARTLGVNSVKLKVGGGYPDRMFLFYEKPTFIEFKKYGKKPDPLQVVRIMELKELNYDVYVCDNVKDAKELIKRRMREKL